MTKSEIENLIDIVDDYVPKHHVVECGNKEAIYCRMEDLYKVLRDLAVEKDNTCGPNYQAMYEQCASELEEARAKIESIKFDMHHISIEHAHYAGAVAAMETIFGRKFEPKK